MDDEEKKPAVKSSAVVKYASFEPPAKFLQLQPKTNLNLPPSNWLRSGSSVDDVIKNMTFSKQDKYNSEFASFSMAHTCPELIGESVDVVSKSSNIKKLLKMPYSKSGHISMMVHRVGKTLLLDEFDIHRHLLRKERDDWQWLRQFYYETILQNMQNDKAKWMINKKNRSRDVLQNRNMFSKFLYYSVDEEEMSAGDSGSISTQKSPAKSPKAAPDTETQDNQDTSNSFGRTTLWTFEDIRMLIETDLPIFGSGTHPCVSLKLQDMTKPINVLTGIDYWLDNLMCNVPEIAMCYHLNGIVEGYELFKTEDIPNLDGSKFSSTVIKDVAQNILSFLKSNATKEGHTYWLFKGNDDDVVKLYDLTTLCADNMSDRAENPFSVPVGILLYRVARNLHHTNAKKKAGTIRTLLKSSLLLLDKEKHSQVVTSANYLMSNLFVPDDDIFTPTHILTSDEVTIEDNEQDDDEEAETRLATPSVEIGTLCENGKFPSSELQRYPPVCGGIEDRCVDGLHHIMSGLHCLDASASVHNNSQEQPDELTQCNPYQAIPMHWTNTQDGQLPGSSQLENSGALKTVSPINKSSLPEKSWHCLSKLLLLKKALMAYYRLAEAKLQQQNYRASVDYVKMALKCYEGLKVLYQSKDEDIASFLGLTLALCGDAILMMSRDLGVKSDDTAVTSQDALTNTDFAIMESIEKEISSFEFDWAYCPVNDKGEGLRLSVRCYQAAQEYISTQNKDACHSLHKKFGNVHNELGVFYMNQAAALQEKNGNTKEIERLCSDGVMSFSKGIELFEAIGDKVNMALLYSNYGRLRRLCAKVYVTWNDDGTRGELQQKERKYYIQAAGCYKEALGSLEKREHHVEIWDSVMWELSSVYFNVATSMQDHAPLARMSQQEVEKDVTELMHDALKYCDVISVTSRQVMCQYRAASIHHRLASLYHHSYRAHGDENKRRKLRLLAEFHYDNASRFFQLVDSPCEQLRVQLERVAMVEYQLAGMTSTSTKMKMLHAAVSYIIGSKSIINNIQSQLQESAAAQSQFEGYVGETEKLLGILLSRLQYLMLCLVKTTAPSGKKTSKTADDHQQCKVLYSMTLKQSSADLTLLNKCCHVLEIIKDIKSTNITWLTS